MEAIGVYEEILATMPKPGERNIEGLRYVLGSEGHEQIFQAGFIIQYLSAKHQ